MPYEFDTTTTKWSPANAKACAWLAQLVYERNADTVRQQLATELGLTSCETLDAPSTDTQAFVASNARLIVVAFRGTELRPEDWKTDLRALLVPFMAGQTAFQGGLVHRGFLKAFTSIWDDVQAAINRQQSGGQTLWLTGHSLGGALATLAAAQLRLGAPRREVAGLYTYGCPRVGNLEFRAAFDTDFSARAFRYVNETDIVPRLAPENLGYTHVGKLLWFNFTGQISKDVGAYQALLAQYELKFEDVLAGVIGPLDNHSIRQYLLKASTKDGQNLA